MWKSSIIEDTVLDVIQRNGDNKLYDNEGTVATLQPLAFNISHNKGAIRCKLFLHIWLFNRMVIPLVGISKYPTKIIQRSPS